MLTYPDYSEYHARKCKICSGHKRIRKDSIWVSCGCQFNATVKWRYDQIPIYPSALKYLKWADFTGISAHGMSRLTPESLVESKTKALLYCFDIADPAAANNRTKHLRIQRHVGEEGSNVIIAGARQSGKSLISALILKEVFHANIICGRSLTFKWAKANEIMDAARWDTAGKNVDNALLDELRETHFLFVDGLELQAQVGDHRWPPDMASINLLFGYRLDHRLPTIINCSLPFWEKVCTPEWEGGMRYQWGDEFLSLLQHPSNVVIELQTEERKR